MFGISADESHCFVKCQPSSEDDLTKMVNAINCAELQCIRYRGNNRTIQIRLVELNEGAMCDALPPDLEKLSEQMEKQAASRQVALRKAQYVEDVLVAQASAVLSRWGPPLPSR